MCLCSDGQIELRDTSHGLDLDRMRHIRILFHFVYTLTPSFVI